MNTFFYKLSKNIFTLYKGHNLLLQIIFIIITSVLVVTGFDWFYYESTRGSVLQSFLFPAVILGFFIPIILFIYMFLYSIITRNKRTLNTTYAIFQAGLLGLGISSLYKVFTGRVGLPHILSSIDTSRIFQFGFYRGGAFEGWPSSHTSVAFAISMALFTLYPENKLIRYVSIAYAFYIGIGVSVNIHWFSDFIAGAILGTIIGITVGKSFLNRYKMI